MAKRAVVDQPLVMVGRGWKHNIDQAIGRDVVKAVVELILNSDDSYRQLEASGRKVSGLIEIHVDRRRGKPSVIVVRDEAAGMTPRQLDRAAGRYGEATASRSVRGFFGRGLKEAILGLGQGTIRTTSRGETTECTLSWEGESPRYRRFKERPAPTGRIGTEITIAVGRTDADIRVPHHEHLVEGLERYFSLRDVMTNAKRKVIVADRLGSRRGSHIEVLTYTEPVGRVLEDGTVIKVPGFGTEFRLRLKRADEPLLTPDEEGSLAHGGILIASGKGILALTLLKYSHDQNADRFLGRVDCLDLDELILNDEPILKQTREVDGLMWAHPFTRALRSAIEEKLRPHVEEEARRNKAAAGARADHEMRKRLTVALKELNAIASSEIGGTGPSSEPYIPEAGFGFVPEYVQVVAHKDAALYLRSVTPARVAEGSEVRVTCDDGCLEIKTEKVLIEKDPAHDGLGRGRVLVKGKVVGAETIVTAKLKGGHTAQALVKVISKRKRPDPPPDGGKTRGLFQDVRPDSDADPRQRAYVRDHVIWIATRAPTVSRYIGSAFEGARDTPEGQVLMAELVTDAVCRELARQRVDKGRLVFPSGGEAEAREREYRRLHSQYSLRIHELFFPRDVRRGRQSAAEMAEEAAVPL